MQEKRKYIETARIFYALLAKVKGVSLIIKERSVNIVF